jgi:dCTP diphosphatase
MNDERLLDVQHLEERLRAFALERDWVRFHSPKNLAMALAGEAGELLEIFQWLTEEESRAVCAIPDSANAVRDELADVLIYLVRLASVLQLDLNEAVQNKMRKNAEKYPPLGAT